jgi:hypothetical protein
MNMFPNRWWWYSPGIHRHRITICCSIFFCFCLALHVNFHVGMRIGINRLNSAIYFCFFNQNDYKLHSRHDVASTACLIIAHKYIPRIREYNKMPGYWWFQTRSIQHSYYYYYYAKYNALTQAGKRIRRDDWRKHFEILSKLKKKRIVSCV